MPIRRDPFTALHQLSGSGESSGSSALHRMMRELQRMMEMLQSIAQDATNAMFQPQQQAPTQPQEGGVPGVGGAGGAGGIDPNRANQMAALNQALANQGVSGQQIGQIDQGMTGGPGGAGPQPAYTPPTQPQGTQPQGTQPQGTQPQGTQPQTTPGPDQGGPGLTTNAGGVAQGKAVSGIDPASKQVVNTGSGTDKVLNVTNDTNRSESFTYSDSDGHNTTMTLAAHTTGTFLAGSQEKGVRVTPTDAAGNAHKNGAGTQDAVLFEDGADLSDPNKQDPDISKVDGDTDSYGNHENMTVTLSDGRTAGDGDAIHAYAYPTDDAASMGLAGDTSKTDNIVMSDA